MNAPLLSVKHLTTDIKLDQGIVRAVKDVSFDLQQEQTLAIVGESGCGKSILCKSILNLLPSNAHISNKSRIILNGKPINNLPEKELNKLRGKSAAMIFQDPLTTLNPVMKIGYQVAETLIHHLKMEVDSAIKKAEDLLKAVGIPNSSQRIHQYPHQLSGGLRQRVAIAIALACEPALLIADEPTTALDVTVQAEILDLLDNLQIQSNMAMILVTHDMNLAANRADQIAVMYGGSIVEYAPANKMIKNPRMPYTKALMDSIPNIENPPHTPLPFIYGKPPNLMSAFSGCCFEPRCTHAARKCMEQVPLLATDGDSNHLFACFNPVEASS